MPGLSKEEREILEAFERGELKRPRGKTRIMEQHVDYAQALHKYVEGRLVEGPKEESS